MIKIPYLLDTMCVFYIFFSPKIANFNRVRILILFSALTLKKPTVIEGSTKVQNYITLTHYEKKLYNRKQETDT